jgi:hypothetical protein
MAYNDTGFELNFVAVLDLFRTYFFKIYEPFTFVAHKKHN